MKKMELTFFLIISSLICFAQTVINERIEINPVSPIQANAPIQNHTVKVDMQWNPGTINGCILFYDLSCDNTTYSSPFSTGTCSYSYSCEGYEYYNLQLRFANAGTNQSVSGTYQLYFDDQLIRSTASQPMHPIKSPVHIIILALYFN